MLVCVCVHACSATLMKSLNVLTLLPDQPPASFALTPEQLLWYNELVSAQRNLTTQLHELMQVSFAFDAGATSPSLHFMWMCVCVCVFFRMRMCVSVSV